MKKGIIFFTFLFFITLTVKAQGEANNWYFGNYAGLTFNTNPPSALTDGAVTTSEGSATISDANGNLLFYTDGRNVYNKTHVTMPNGTGLFGDPSSAQSAIIIPKPGSKTNYFIITVPEKGDTGMRYSEVNISLNGGLGDVLTSNKNTLMFKPSSEKVTAVRHANGLYFWVIGRGNSTAQNYIAFLVDCNGINVSSPVTSVVSTTNGENWGYLTATPDGSKLASASSGSGIEIVDFNTATGVVSNPINLGTLSNGGTTGGNYGIAFSPNSKVLYAASITNWGLFQWDLTAGNIPNSKVYIGDLAGGGASRPNYRGGALQLGPDGKIYTAETQLFTLGVIHNPNVVGTGCNLQNNAVSLNSRKCVLGLPPFIQSFFNTSDISYSHHCFGEQTDFTLSGASYLDSVKWDFKDPASGIANTSTLFNPSHTFTSAGTYNVQLVRFLDCSSDTLYQNVVIHAPDTTQQTITLCANSAFVLPDGQSVSQTGVYTSTIQSLVTGCDSVVVTTLQAPQTLFSAGTDQYICKNNSTQLQAGTALNYSWSPATGLSSTTVANPTANPTVTTTYTVSSQVQLSNNLVVNGDFESGNTGFYTGYLLSPPNPLGGPGHYTVGKTISNNWWQNCADHTSGTGNMLIADGANGTNGVAGGANVWCQTIQVMPNTDYAFSTWLTNLNSSGSTSTLGFSINGTPIGQPQNTPLGVCQWNQFYVIWNSGNQTSATICIAETSGAQPGNDYALDDISFYQICTITDSVTVYVSDIQIDTTIQNVDCFSNATGSISATATGGIGTHTYSWSNGSNNAINNNLTAGNYTLIVEDSIHCQQSVSVTITEPTELIVSAVANNIIECTVTNTGNATVTATGGTPNYTYLWDNQESTATATQLSPGAHQVVVTDAHNCQKTVSVTIDYKEPPTLTISTNNVCLNTPSNFTSQASIGAPETISTYQWTITNQSTQQTTTSTETNPTITINSAGNYTATLIVTSSNGCTTEKSVSFEVYANPTATIVFEPSCFQIGNFHADAKSLNNLDLTYEWDIYNDQTVDYTTVDFSQYFESAAPFDIRLKVTDTRGCIVELVQPIKILEGKADIEFPNVLSTKSQVGNNQVDLEQIMPNFNSCIDYTLRIFNRWGNVVFEVKNSKDNPDLNCSNCFKGKTTNGKDLTPGTYFYTLDAEYDIKKTGFITVVGD